MNRPPIRLSVEPTDPGYSRFASHPGIRVLVDGIECRDVFTIDEVKGEAFMYGGGPGYEKKRIEGARVELQLPPGLYEEIAADRAQLAPWIG